jgi:hypothetical protein
MENLLRLLIHLLALAIGVAIVILAGIWSKQAALFLFLLGGVLYGLALRRGTFSLRKNSLPSPTNSLRDAKLMVTQILKSLTQVQVAYLCQNFTDRQEGRAWLKKALPSSFQTNLDELHHDLEKARLGAPVPGLKLVRAILSLKDRLFSLEEALKEAAQKHPDYTVSHPVIFVITDHIDGETMTEPKVIILAGWNTDNLTLLPHVDKVTIFSQIDGENRMRGQVTFDNLLAGLSQHLQPLDHQSPTIYRAAPLPESSPLPVTLEKIPLGFAIGAAEII